VSLEGAPQRSVTLSEGDGYSKVVKQTILKSDGDHTEVCIPPTVTWVHYHCLNILFVTEKVRDTHSRI